MSDQKKKRRSFVEQKKRGDLQQQKKRRSAVDQRKRGDLQQKNGKYARKGILTSSLRFVDNVIILPCK